MLTWWRYNSRNLTTSLNRWYHGWRSCFRNTYDPLRLVTDGGKWKCESLLWFMMLSQSYSSLSQSIAFRSSVHLNRGGLSYCIERYAYLSCVKHTYGLMSQIIISLDVNSHNVACIFSSTNLQNGIYGLLCYYHDRLTCTGFVRKLSSIKNISDYSTSDRSVLLELQVYLTTL